MKSANPSIGELLAGHVDVVHTKWRFSLQKRIVELNGSRYVLYRFRSKTMMRRFEDALALLSAAGVPVQSVCARTSTVGGYLRHGHWLALSYLPGHPLGKNPGQRLMTELGKTMAKVNGIAGPQRQSLFSRRRPELPHRAYLEMATGLDDRQREWISASLARLERLQGAQLTHGDLFVDNIIVMPDKSIGLIDYELMAYDLSGIELAGTLLRSFCRKNHTRRALLRAYMAACPPKLKAAWTQYCRDFVFAAAARLVLARQERLRHIARKQRFLSLRSALPFGPTTAEVARQRKAYQGIIRSAKKNEEYYLHILRTMIDICIKNKGIGAVALLDKCDRTYRSMMARRQDTAQS